MHRGPRRAFARSAHSSDGALPSRGRWSVELNRCDTKSPNRARPALASAERPRRTSPSSIMVLRRCSVDPTRRNIRAAALDEVGSVSSASEAWPDADERFWLMYGCSRAELASRGVDLDTFLGTHAGGADQRLYEHYAKRLADGRSVLPYWSMGSWIARGRTKFSQSWIGTVTVTEHEIRLADEDLLAAAPPQEIDVTPVRGWLGMGLRLRLGSSGVWYVQARYCPTSVRRARAATRVFAAALKEAGGRFS